MGYKADSFPLTIPSGGNGMCVEKIARNNPTYLRTTGIKSLPATYSAGEVMGLDNNDAALLGTAANSTISIVREGITYPVTAKDISSSGTGVRTTSITSTAFLETYEQVTQNLSGTLTPVVFGLFSDGGATDDSGIPGGTADQQSGFLNVQLSEDIDSYLTNLPFRNSTPGRHVYVRVGGAGPLRYYGTIEGTTDTNGNHSRTRMNTRNNLISDVAFVSPGDEVWATRISVLPNPDPDEVVVGDFDNVDGSDIMVNFTHVTDTSIATQMTHITPPGVTIQAFSNTGRTTAVTNAVIINDAPNGTGDI